MSEAVEYRLASLKTGIGAVTVLLSLIATILFLTHEWLLFATAQYVGTIALFVVLLGRQKDGWCRRLAEAIPQFDYGDPPLEEWEADLEERGVL